MAGWCRTQKPTALSSGESEFYSATVCACELLWACESFRDLGYTMTARLKEDASACIVMATRLGPGRLKQHVEIKHFALRHCVRQGRLTLDKVMTTQQLADIITKPFSFQTLSTLAPRIGLTKCVWISDARKALKSTSMIICDGTFPLENLTSFQYFASGTCRYCLNLWHVGCYASLHPRGCAAEFDRTVTRTGTPS